jgi:hypothetical protein
MIYGWARLDVLYFRTKWNSVEDQIRHTVVVIIPPLFWLSHGTIAVNVCRVLELTSVTKAFPFEDRLKVGRRQFHTDNDMSQNQGFIFLVMQTWAPQQTGAVWSGSQIVSCLLTSHLCGFLRDLVKESSSALCWAELSGFLLLRAIQFVICPLLS